MKHSEVEELLAAYALDAVEPDEIIAVEEHLSECPRCRAEVASHRDVAGMFSSSPSDAPPELWERISRALSEPDPAFADSSDQATLPKMAPIRELGSGERSATRRLLAVSGVLGAFAAAAAALVIVLSIQVSHLNGRVAAMQSVVGNHGLDSAVAAALLSRHQEAVLTGSVSSSVSGRRRVAATVLLTPSGQAYWVKSNLPKLAASQTYQVWALVDGQPVSVGLVGQNPSSYSAFRVGPRSKALMVTVEPAGGTPSPTTPVLVQETLTT
jgi:anti-sigma factor RsiW